MSTIDLFRRAHTRIFRRKKTRFSASVYVQYQNTILLIHHRRLGMWVPVGGSIELNETPLQAARRELLEEAGMDADFPVTRVAGDTTITAYNIPGFVRYEELYDDPHKGIGLNFVFFARTHTNFVVPNHEVYGYRWVGSDCDELRNVPQNVRENVALLASR